MFIKGLLVGNGVYMVYGRMGYLMKYERLVNEFETGLGRKLKKQERDFITWIWEKHKKEKKLN